MDSFSLMVSRCTLETNTGFSIAVRLGSSSSDSDSSSLSSSSSSGSASCSALSKSSSSFRRSNATSLALSRRNVRSSLSSMSSPLISSYASSTTGCKASAPPSSDFGPLSSHFTASSASSGFSSAEVSRMRASCMTRCRSSLSPPVSQGPWAALRRLRRLLATSSSTIAVVFFRFSCLRASRDSSGLFSSDGLSFLLALPSVGSHVGAFPGQYLATFVELSYDGLNFLFSGSSPRQRMEFW
mmetsp:Transcript_129266/g.359995  ORF Transcript_129266/g.359995 Transcript_129266/m.359995 type:complete len:241 (-) Transcript_129266:123-845(-)